MTLVLAAPAKSSKNAMARKEHILKFRAINRDIFNAIKSGKKKIETRAGSTRYQSISKGDTVILVCGESKIRKVITSVEKFKSIKGILKKYKAMDINPKTKTLAEAEAMYYSFPGYREKIKKYGLIAIKLK